MKVLVVGGSGYVASLVLPALAKAHTLRVFDLKPPVNPPENVTYAQGNVCDPGALLAASAGLDTLLYMAMGPNDWSLPGFHGGSFDSNVKGVYLALQAARSAGITH